MDSHTMAKLHALGACAEALAWAEGQKDAETAWERCPCGDWLIRCAAHAGVDMRRIVQSAIGCARMAVGYACEEHLIALLLPLHVAMEWCRGRATEDDVRATAGTARAAARAAATRTPPRSAASLARAAGAAAACAATGAMRAIITAADAAAYGATAPAYAACAAADAASFAAIAGAYAAAAVAFSGTAFPETAYMAALAIADADTAKIVRRSIPWAILRRAWRGLEAGGTRIRTHDG